MDGHRFDDWARRLAANSSRRGVLRGLLGGAAGALGLAGARGAAAAVCRPAGSTCREHANCCSKLCGPKDATGRRRCQCQTIADCPAPDQCHSVACVAGACVETVLTGQACVDGNGCTTGETCQANGTCGGGTATVCPAPQDQCHVAGTCDPITGLCSNPNAPDGTTCDDNNICTTGETCQSGTCTGTATNEGLACGDGLICCAGVCKGAANTDCSSGTDCCSGLCSPVGCCPICPSGCECRTSSDQDAVCVVLGQGEGCSVVTGCSAGQACVGGICMTTCSPVG